VKQVEQEQSDKSNKNEIISRARGAEQEVKQEQSNKSNKNGTID
jgi:hypothetical protein